MPLTEEERQALFGSGDSTQSETDAQRRARIKQSLRDAGFDIPYTDSELLDQIGSITAEPNPYSKAAEDIFQQGLTNPSRANPFDYFAAGAGSAPQEQAFEAARSKAIQDRISSLLGGDGDRTFRPSVLQQPSAKDLFSSVEQAALGPAPDLLFRDVFNEAFPDIGKGQGPFEAFAQKQASQLESQFMTGVFKQFEQPGFIDSLRGDYEKLYRQKESGDFNGSGGSIPAFEDYIKGRVSGDYRSFLDSQHENVRKAFALASPDQRGQRDQGSLAPPARIL